MILYSLSLYSYSSYSLYSFPKNYLNLFFIITSHIIFLESFNISLNFTIFNACEFINKLIENCN